MGDRKVVHDDERPIRAWAFRSLVTTRAVHTGEMLTDDMVWSKRPGSGIPAHRMDEVVGRRARRGMAENVLITWDDLES